ncbi:hypothetical protein COB57_00620 [Candidatus Peregrinibacteria bacterium]|nr:MAG: hypothetical protein COB57_00620 [Candidatus Peregrinibacteria bacterium]
MTDLILLGRQGCGKGTQGNVLSERYGYIIFEAGKACRDLAKQDTPLGKTVKDIINAGKLTPAPLLMGVLEEFLQQHVGEPLIFDGIPRSMDQCKLFEALLKKYDREPTCVYIKIPTKTCIERLSHRFKCIGVDKQTPSMTQKECVLQGGTIQIREDDTEDAIVQRLNAFEENTRPVIRHFKKLKRKFSINGHKSYEHVSTEMEKIIGLFLLRDKRIK